MKNYKTLTMLLLIIIALSALTAGCSDEAPIVKTGEIVVEEVNDHRRDNWRHEIEVTYSNGYVTTYFCNKYNELKSEFDGGVLLRMTDCAPTGVNYDISWLKDHTGPTYEVK